MSKLTKLLLCNFWVHLFHSPNQMSTYQTSEEMNNKGTDEGILPFDSGLVDYECI